MKMEHFAQRLFFFLFAYFVGSMSSGSAVSDDVIEFSPEKVTPDDDQDDADARQAANIHEDLDPGQRIITAVAHAEPTDKEQDLLPCRERRQDDRVESLIQ